MEELLWYSMPGAFLATAIITIFPETADSDPKVVLWIVIVPVIGFIVHQIFRLSFEKTGGFARKSRSVLAYISKNLGAKSNTVIENNKKAFLVWETTFYSNEFPSSFREHDRRTWHFILSFWGISFSAMIAFTICVGAYITFSQDPKLIMIGILYLLSAVVFRMKGFSSYDSLKEQEIAIVFANENLFLTTLNSLKNMN